MMLNCLHPPRLLLIFFWDAFQEATARSNDGAEIQSEIYTYELSGPPFGSRHLWCWYRDCGLKVSAGLYRPLEFIID